ncbi:MAG: hypothetical protein MZV64_73830 [Ignavibacteriales bacterium]|nr:hypothetical protein [Ignavibacteriales bacterium]
MNGKKILTFLQKVLLTSESAEMQISKAALQALNDYTAGKEMFRELESVIKRAVIFANSEKRNMVQLT